MRTQLIIL